MNNQKISTIAKIIKLLKFYFFYIFVTYSSQINALDKYSTCYNIETPYLGNYVISIDTWGISKLKGDPNLSIICVKGSTNANNNISMQAIWNLGEPTDNIIAYPYISYGIFGWNNQKKVPNLPTLISDVPKIESDANYTIKSDNIYNVTYDIWFSNKENPKIDDMKVELMIFTDWDNVKPLGDKIGSIELNDEIYNIYYKKRHRNWAYIALIIDYTKKSLIAKSIYEKYSRQITSSKHIDITKVLNYLISIDILDKSLYLNSIQFGSELRGGEGIFNIHNFSVNIK